MLPAPAEILELRDGESLSFHITNYQIDEGIIRPAHAPQGKAIRILRVHVPPTDKSNFPYYWDVTGAGLIAQLLPILEAGNFLQRVFTMTANGNGPKRRYALEVI